mgnify:CR=1 FL=1|tara:strand:- start:5740 stop:6408 length:669 start_codon:yes stop_codon:yes gene_type:complete
MITSLYRHFDHEGALLYVGISLSWPARTKQHAHGSRWFDLVAKVEIERFPTRAAALEAERQAIKSEKPKFNIVHNREAKPEARAHKPYSVIEDPALQHITGPDVIVGPVLNYRDDTLSFIIAQGETGSPGELVELVIGEWAGEIPEWADAADAVFSIRSLSQFTMEEARKVRSDIVGKLQQHMRTVETFGSDIALAVANASRFPSEKARQILDEVAVDRGGK